MFYFLRYVATSVGREILNNQCNWVIDVKEIPVVFDYLNSGTFYMIHMYMYLSLYLCYKFNS